MWYKSLFLLKFYILEAKLKKCYTCKEIKDESCFSKDKNRKDGLCGKCKSCVSIYNHNRLDISRERKKLYRQTNREKTREQQREYYSKYHIVHKRQVRNANLIRKYGITIQQYDKMFEDQGGCCYICGKPDSNFAFGLGVDHDHETVKIRGLLCKNCNQGIGFLQDNIELLRKEIEYLTLFK